MILRIVRAKVCGPHLLDLTFNDGVRKRVNVMALLRGPIFEPLQSPVYFARAKLNAECGIVEWPNGADLAPETLYELSSQNDAGPIPRKTAKGRNRTKAARKAKV